MPNETPLANSSPGNREVMISLSYLWLLALVPLLVEVDDKEVQWHARNGLLLFLADIVVLVPLAIVQVGLGSLFGFIFAIAVSPLLIGIAALHLLAIWKGVNGGRLMVPGLSKFASRL